MHKEKYKDIEIKFSSVKISESNAEHLINT